MRRTPISLIRTSASARGAVDVPEFCAFDARADTLQRVASEIFSSLGSIGKVRMRLPVTAKIAFVTAAATAAVGEAT